MVSDGRSKRFSYEDMTALLAEKGCRLTEQRNIILKSLLSFPLTFSPMDLEKRLMKTDPALGRATIFRAIDLFLEMGILEKIHRESGDDVYLVGSVGHHHHLICRVCGEIRDINFCPFEEGIHEIMRKEGYSEGYHRIEIEGICGVCKKVSEKTQDDAEGGLRSHGGKVRQLH
ncbi:MAG: Fur family transcriptional regulator [Leptospirillum sp.]